MKVSTKLEVHEIKYVNSGFLSFKINNDEYKSNVEQTRNWN